MSEVSIYLVLGYISTTVGIIQSIPSLALMYRLKHCEETSLLTLAMRYVGTAASSVYIQGVVEDAGYSFALPMIISNVASWITLLIVTYFKLVLFKGNHTTLEGKSKRIADYSTKIQDQKHYSPAGSYMQEKGIGPTQARFEF